MRNATYILCFLYSVVGVKVRHTDEQIIQKYFKSKEFVDKTLKFLIEDKRTLLWQEAFLK